MNFFRGGGKEKEGWLGGVKGWRVSGWGGGGGGWGQGNRGDLSKARSLILRSAKRSHDAGGLATAVKAI